MGENTHDTGDGGVEQIPDGNRFKPVVETLRDAGWSYERIWEEIEDAYNPIDRASLLETSPDDEVCADV